MNVELKRIAEKKLEQMGATVHGVLVKNEAGAWAAVSEGGRVMWLDDFEPVPAARNEDVALPSHATKSDLIDCIDLMADEFKRIKALNPGDEILDLCDRALRVTEQNVPVLEVRDRLQKTVSKLLWKVSDLEDQLEAARAQSGQGVEPVAWVAPTATGIFYGETAEEAAANAESFGATLAGTIPLYTHPQPAQQGSVPEGWKLVPVEPTKEMRDAAQDAFEHGVMITYQGLYRAMIAAAHNHHRRAKVMSDWNVNDPRVAAISAIRDREYAECQHNDWMTFGKELVVCAGCEVDASEIVGKLRQQLEQAEARVAELEKAGRMLSFSEWKKHLEREDVQECGHVVYRSPAEKSLLYAKYRQSCEQNLDSLILRKQAEAVEAIANKLEGMNLMRPDEFLRSNAERLRQQADEAEQAGGEK